MSTSDTTAVDRAAEQLWSLRCDCEHSDLSDWGWFAVTQHHPSVAQEYRDMAEIVLGAASGQSKMSDERTVPDATVALPEGWRHASTVPRDGYEFEYLRDDGSIRRGILAERIHKDPRMVAWRSIGNHD